MQGLVNLIMKTPWGVQIRKKIYEVYKYKPAHWMQTEYDDNVLEFCKLPKGKI